MRILIAEDEVTIARALKVMLEKDKYTVDLVHNGNDALDYIRAAAYDALVLDIMMPGKDGIQVLKTVRARMGVALHDGLQPLPQGIMLGGADLIFQLMPVFSTKLHGLAPFCVLWASFYRASLKCT